MKWYKHDSDASRDSKIQRVILKYGMEGYGLYFFCLELIASSVAKHNLTFELEHDSELIAAMTNIHFERVQEMMVDYVKWGLFQDIDGKIFCLKMASRTDEYTQQLMRFHEKGSKTPDKLRGTRTEQIRTEKKNTRSKSFDLFWLTYPKKVKRIKAADIWKRKKLDDQAPKIIADIKNRSANDGRWLDGFIPDPTTYLNGERWEDEVQAPRVNLDMNSKSQIMRIGSQRGLQPRPGESMEDYDARIRMAR